MLKEYSYPKAGQKNLRRRWFLDESMDLIIWVDQSGSIQNFQLCYSKQENERALVWDPIKGCRHFRVDSGEPGPLKNLSPMMEDDERVDIGWLRRSFGQRAKEIDVAVRDFVRSTLRGYGE